MRPRRSSVSETGISIERKTQILRIILGLTVMSFVTFLITLTSSKWVVITYPENFFSKRQNMTLQRSTYGIIWECFTGRTKFNSIYENKCNYHANEALNKTSLAEEAVIRMIRTMLSFSIIYALLMIITFIFGLYSIRDYRYTYKRLTGMIYIITAVSLLVCIEVLTMIFRYSTEHLPDIYPPDTQHSYGPCFIIAWIIFVLLLIFSLIFFAFSRKRKGTFDEATEEEALANRPVDLGRSFR